MLLNQFGVEAIIAAIKVFRSSSLRNYDNEKLRWKLLISGIISLIGFVGCCTEILVALLTRFGSIALEPDTIYWHFIVLAVNYLLWLLSYYFYTQRYLESWRVKLIAFVLKNRLY